MAIGVMAKRKSRHAFIIRFCNTVQLCNICRAKIHSRKGREIHKIIEHFMQRKSIDWIIDAISRPDLVLQIKAGVLRAFLDLVNC